MREAEAQCPGDSSSPGSEIGPNVLQWVFNQLPCAASGYATLFSFMGKLELATRFFQ